MNCPYCGKNIEDGSAFCFNCGQSLGNSNFVYSDTPSENEGKKSSGKGSKKAIIAIIAVLSVLLLALAAVIVLEVTDVIDIGAISTKEDDTDNDTDKIEKETEEESEEAAETEESTSENDTEAPSIPDRGVYYDKITVGTGAINGTYYALTSALCNAIKNDDYSFEVVSSGGSAANINSINDGTYQMAICQNDVMNYAYNGENGFDSPVRGFSAIGCIYPEICQIITTEDSGIYSISDLRGKNVAIGDIGSGVYYNAVQILEAAGIDPENDINTVYSSFGDSVISLKDGSIDAAFITAGVPATAVTDLAASTKTVALSLPKDVIEELIREYPYYTEYTLTSEDYDFITSPVSTVCIKAAYIVTNDMSEQQVYEITKALWENPDVRTSHAKAEEMDIYTTLAGIGSVPLHPGAERYYKEKGIIKNTDSDFVTRTDGVLTMATNAVFPPYEYKNGYDFEGIDIEIAEEIAKKLGLTLEIQDVEFASIIDGVQSGKFDIGIAGMTVTEDRLHDVNFTIPYATNSQVAILKADSGITCLEDLKADGSMKYGVQQDTTGDIYASDTVENGGFGLNNVVSYKTGREAVEALKKGSVQAVIIDFSVAQELVKANEGLSILETAWAEEEYSICVSKENFELLNAINEALNELKSDGTIDAIIDKYI